MNIDWPGLRAAATDAARRAYAPYSRLLVGAAGLTDDGRLVSGCNVENASFGLTLCAECGLVSALHASRALPVADGSAGPAGPADFVGAVGAPPVRAGDTGGAHSSVGRGGPAGPGGPGRRPPMLVAVAVVAGDGEPLLPCGRCRQLLMEAGGPALLVDTADGPVPLGELLPAAFGGADLSARRSPGA